MTKPSQNTWKCNIQKKQSRQNHLSYFIILAVLLQALGGHAKKCSNDTDCWTGSYCRGGYCSNPFASGCLHESLPDWTLLRVCNSEDVDGELCRPNDDFDYPEIRLFADNWDSAIYAAWIMQILLSEILQVPTTIETGSPTAEASFYHPDSRLEYGPSNEPEVLENANRLVDCRLAKQTKNSNLSSNAAAAAAAPSNQSIAYTPCAHAVLESWSTESFWAYQQSDAAPIVEPPQTSGLLGQEHWFVTKFTAEEHPSVIGHFGLARQREQLARLFLRPTTWNDYCAQESSHNCTLSDATAQRAPHSTEEGDHYFVPGLYQGYFRNTHENDCVHHPHNCTGHIADYACGWKSTVEAQAHHLQIALRSSGPEGPARGYRHPHLQEIWRAANATRSHAIMYYWYPEPLYHEFAGTDAEMTPIVLPPPTQDCYDHKVGTEARCSPDWRDRVGTAAGVCDNLPDLLDKTVTASLYDWLHDPAIPAAARSPAYEAIRAFHMDNLKLGELFQKQFVHEHPRAAVCEWITENRDYLWSMVPPTYPRRLEPPTGLFDWLTIACLVVGVATALLVVATAGLVYANRHKKSILVAQTDFLFLVLLGAGLLAVGASLRGLPPQPWACLAAPWLVTVGYTLQLIPLIVKMAAIHRVVGAARRMRRVVLRRRKLFWAVAAVVLIVASWLLAWSLSDPPVVRGEFQLILVGSSDDDGGGVDGDDDHNDIDANTTMVRVSDYCASTQSVWEYAVVGWDSILLLAASVIAYQTRNLNPKFNESRTLAFLIYSHAFFVLLRLTVSGGSLLSRASQRSKLESLVWSADTVVGLGLYFYPLLTAVEDSRRSSVSVSFMPPDDDDDEPRSYIVTTAPVRNNDTTVRRHPLPAPSDVVVKTDFSLSSASSAHGTPAGPSCTATLVDDMASSEVLSDEDG